MILLLSMNSKIIFITFDLDTYKKNKLWIACVCNFRRNGQRLRWFCCSMVQNALPINRLDDTLHAHKRLCRKMVNANTCDSTDTRANILYFYQKSSVFRFKYITKYYEDFYWYDCLQESFTGLTHIFNWSWENNSV